MGGGGAGARSCRQVVSRYCALMRGRKTATTFTSARGQNQQPSAAASPRRSIPPFFFASCSCSEPPAAPPVGFARGFQLATLLSHVTSGSILDSNRLRSELLKYNQSKPYPPARLAAGMDGAAGAAGGGGGGGGGSPLPFPLFLPLLSFPFIAAKC